MPDLRTCHWSNNAALFRIGLDRPITGTIIFNITEMEGRR